MICQDKFKEKKKESHDLLQNVYVETFIYITETGQKKEKGTRALLVASLDDKKKRHWQKEDE